MSQMDTHANNAPEKIVEKNVLIFIRKTNIFPLLFCLSNYITADFIYKSIKVYFLVQKGKEKGRGQCDDTGITLHHPIT